MYYGWKIVGVAFVAQFIAVGFVMYSYGVLFKALAADFGGSRLGVASGLTIMQIAIALFAPPLGRALDRGSIRAIMIGGALSAAAGFLLAARMTALWQWYVLLSTLIGLGTAALGTLAANTLVARWFVARRGIALGLAAIGVSASGALMAPASSVLMGAVGWRGAFLFYAAILLLLMVPVLWIFVRTPEELGVRIEDEADPPPGDPTDVQTAPEASTVPLDAPATPSVLRDPKFWIITVGLGLNVGVNAAFVTHIVPHGTDLGFAATEVAFSVSLVGLLAAAGKPLFGRLVDRIDARIAFALTGCFQMAGLCLLIASQAYWSVFVASALYGFGLGGVIPIWGAVVGAGFGRLAFGSVTGLTMLWMLPIRSIPNPLAGHLYDRLGSYDLAFQMMLGHIAASVLVFCLLRLPPVEPGR